MVRSEIVTRHVAGSLWLVQLEGEHDISTVPRLRRELDRLFDMGTCIVVDLAAVTFIDSSILGELIRGDLHARSSPGETMAVVAPSSSAAARLFDLVDARHTCFPVFESVATAIDSCRDTATRPA